MDYLIHLLIFITIYSILALSLNLVVGYTGLLSINHASFYGIGAYVTAILSVLHSGVPSIIILFASIVVSMISALLVGVSLSRFKGDIYALGSLGFAIIVYGLMLNLKSVTRGPLGIPGIPKPHIFGEYISDNFSFLLFSLGLFFVVFFVIRYLTRSSYGRVLQAIRENELVVKLLGYNTYWYKLSAFIISAGVAAAAGFLFATYITFIDPSSFTLNESIFILSMVILGGLASNRGSIIGASLLILLPEILRFVGFPTSIAAQMRQVVYGLLLVFIMMYHPKGIFGRFKL